jgi:hypothetical protein
MTALRHARDIYRRASAGLLAELDRLGKELASEEAGKRLLALIAMHQKALHTVLEFEKSLEKRIAERIGRRRGELDVEAARREVLGKLSRLADDDRA